ncbi:hypothetical protein [Radiobacillus sp. PE A8.2]|uniref:hypothetical protein n=1 Tax=Radiobacillus sp. PE A8.2 TaxID=3380349 RepID=UPI00388FEBD2
MEYNYTFEKVRGEKLFQVRLNGEYITYAEDTNPKRIDEWLKKQGFNSREDFFNNRKSQIVNYINSY